ncbi:tetraacyldisaccharide 4'-kinase [Pseudoduganella eburnea]|uniref:Tetraacyldisaccharide 4'-kinase n=1 Tax=Massilia eburnea TaxID=1776165 RepID=A0A6L6QDT2_9BURK|nr:tetraacyldisaccharide 4'-kinase [Massilia eburnea]MTW10668.1 tetraacyldisaccharide 4'-kinase [Massilia eburnea]
MASSLETTFSREWLRRGALACALWPLSLLFRFLAAARRAAFAAGLSSSERLPVPVVVVGNIFIGGTGKTPLTIWLVDALRAAGFRPGVVSRGFGGKDAAPREVGASSTPSDVGDEPVLIAARTGCPVFVGRARAAAGRALLAAHPEVNVIVTDDGLQHYALARDVEIVLFDGRGVGNGWTLPAGPLREPPSRQRDFTVVNAPELTPALAAAVAPPGATRPSMPAVSPSVAPDAARQAGRQAATWQMRLAGDVAERLADRAERMTLAELARRSAPPEAGQGTGLRVAAAAGIGNPARFFGMLKAAGIEAQELPLPDHHDFKDRPFAHLQADFILVTEKDAVKCWQIEELRNDPRIWVVPVSARIDAALADQIVEKLRGRTPA